MQHIARIEEPRSFKRTPLPLTQGNTFVRHLTAKVISTLTGTPARMVAAQMWPSDRLIGEILERATAAPAMTTVTGWAAELAARRVADAVEALGPASAAAAILKRAGLLLDFGNFAQISAPGFIASGANAGFVAEGDPIPVRQLADAAALLLAYKLASIAVLTREMIESSNAEQLIADALNRSAGLALDGILLDANPATAARPAGLRNGIAAMGASSQSDPLYAFGEDLASLGNAVGAVGGAGPYILVASPGRVMGMAIHFSGDVSNLTVIGSGALTNDIVMIAPGALVAAIDPEPAIDTSKAASLHMDTAPTAVGTASPHKSMYQTDSLALKVRWPVSWILRDPRGVAWMTPTWK